MQTKDFDFDLPQELIAQYPAPERGNDRLLVLHRKTGTLTDAFFSDLPNLLPADCLMVFNNAKVRNARIYAKTESGREIEFLLLEPLDEGYIWKVLVKRAKRQTEGKRYIFADGTQAVLTEFPLKAKPDKVGKYIRFNKCITDKWLAAFGHIPLPPYIKRADTVEGASRYQTIYAKTTGSAAAPTAGLHFTQPIFNALDAKHIEQTAVTLHVGLGTFLPVRTETVEDHIMHTEKFIIDSTAALAIERAYTNKRPIAAIGTTSVRTIESAWNAVTHTVQQGMQETNIFIYPGFHFSLTDILLTNFHTPQSSLMMLVSAFVGKDILLDAYRYAIEKKYRFFSYGDAMLII